jgi:hypothetical protein
MPKEKVESKKFIITQEQIDAVIGNMTNRFLLKAKWILMKDLQPFSSPLADKFKLFEKSKMKWVNNNWEVVAEDWEEFKRGFEE